jgi:hypothetical protein
MIGRLIRRILGIAVLASIVSAVAALVAKQRLISIGEPEDDEIALVAIFEPLQFASTAPAFRGGSLITWYGGGEVDLRGATLDPAGARLTVKAMFGGAQLVVPDEWQVDIDMVGILGGVGDARPARGRPADAPRLVIDGIAAFGGVGITSSTKDLEIDA